MHDIGPPPAPATETLGGKAGSRVLRVLRCFIEDAEPRSVRDLSRELGMTKSMVHRALTTLARHGYLVRDPTEARYQLGHRVIDFGLGDLGRLDLVALCRPHLHRLRDLTGETVSLAIPMGDAHVVVDGVQGDGRVCSTVPLGRPTPLHASPASRAILAHLPDRHVEAILARPLQRFTPATLVDRRALRSELARVRRQGYAVGFGDHLATAEGGSFPVLDGSGVAHGAVTVSAPKGRFGRDRLDALLPDLQRVIGEINRHTRLYPAARNEIPDDG